jgi:hypothetical protein
MIHEKQWGKPKSPNPGSLKVDTNQPCGRPFTPNGWNIKLRPLVIWTRYAAFSIIHGILWKRAGNVNQRQIGT